MSPDKKFYLFRIFDAIADCLHIEGDIDKVYGGNGDPHLQLLYMGEIMEKSHENKTISIFLKDMLKGLLQNTTELDLKSMASNYRKFLYNTDDEQLRE